MKPTYEMIYGTHAVTDALTLRPDVVRTVYLIGDEQNDVLLTLIERSGVKRREKTKKLPKGVPLDAVHQGVVAEIDTAKLTFDFDDFMRAITVTEHTALVLLGEVQDPQNVGAVIRSASAFGVAGVLIPEHRQAQVNGTVVKVSAGTAFRVPLISVGNVNQAVRDLKDRGFWIYGLDGEASQTLEKERFEKPSVFILGNEATGIRPKTLELCDIPLRIPMTEKTESLNASAAAAVVLYAWSSQHHEVL